MARKAFTFESNLDKIIPKIKEAPEKVLKIVGRKIVQETRDTLPKRSGKLKKSLGYWARKEEKDLLIGFYENKKPGKEWAAFYSSLLYGETSDPIRPVVQKNAELIQDMLKIAIEEIGKK